MSADKISVDLCNLCMEPLPCRCVRESGMRPKTMERWESKAYLSFVRSLPCSVPNCGAQVVEAAHFGRRPVGRKVHDCLAIPLCHKHHMLSHKYGSGWEWSSEVVRWQLQTMTAFIVRELGK